MTLILSTTEYRQLHQKKTKQSNQNLFLEDFETIYQKPDCLQQSGFTCRIELMPGVYLYILNWQYSQEMILKVPVRLHPVQVLILTSGFISFDIYPTLGGKRSYFSGSGISPAFVERYQQLSTCSTESDDYPESCVPLPQSKSFGASQPRSQHISGINIQIDPEVLIGLFPDLLNQREDFIKLLLNSDQPKTSFFPEVTRSMLSIVKQIINAPFRGAIKKIYLQGKVLELLALQLEAISTQYEQSRSSKFKPESIDRIYYARNILDRSYKNPPSIVELARIVGISDRTLQRGFRQLFDTTVIGYITYLRIEQAEQLLRSGDLSVAEVANLVGYSHLGHFAAAFKRQIGITPSQCSSGKLASK